MTNANSLYVDTVGDEIYFNYMHRSFTTSNFASTKYLHKMSYRKGK